MQSLMLFPTSWVGGGDQMQVPTRDLAKWA